jgi:hypothetical protein
MKKATLAAGVLAFVALACSTLPAMAQDVNLDEPKILVHISSTTTKSACTTHFTNQVQTCDDHVTSATSGAGQLYYLYVTVALGDSILNLAGMQFGITYDDGMVGDAADGTGIEIFGWTLCATLEFPMPTPAWGEPTSGNLITWDSTNRCQENLALDVSTVGYFYIGAYSPSTFCITERPVDSAAKVASCAAEEVIVHEESLGCVSFSAGGTTEGCNPCLELCGAVPTIDATWGKIKSLMTD